MCNDKDSIKDSKAELIEHVKYLLAHCEETSTRYHCGTSMYDNDQYHHWTGYAQALKDLMPRIKEL